MLALHLPLAAIASEKYVHPNKKVALIQPTIAQRPLMATKKLFLRPYKLLGKTNFTLPLFRRIRKKDAFLKKAEGVILHSLC